MALARAQTFVVQQYNSITSPEVRNYEMSTMALAVLGAKSLLIDGFSDCGGFSYSNMLSMAFFAGMAVNQYGLENTKKLVVNNSFALFNTVKQRVMPTAEPEPAAPTKKMS